MSRLARIVAPALARARIVAPALARARIVAPALALLAVPFVPAQAATEVEVVTSPGGIVAWLVEEPSIPMVAMEISFKGGASREPDERVGVTHFLSTMLDEGAGELDSAAFSARADQLAMRYGFEAGRDSFTVSARMLSETREDSVELLRSALVEPRFDPEPLERMRASILSTLRDQATDPQAILARTWRERLFG
ncbi:MAG: M16 family metallopeptidase, partial [Albimonas sp.]|uniref:M16 family metallopeptidase n=1 Tax=Albimonas sp. TaxID=1872425 RepID=UPI0040566DA1